MTLVHYSGSICSLSTMATSSSSSLIRGDTFLYIFALFTLCSLFVHHISAASGAAGAHFEGFDADEDDDFAITDQKADDTIPSPLSTAPSISLSTSTPESHHGPPDPQIQSSAVGQSTNSNPRPASTKSFEYWDEDEFEGIPQDLKPSFDGWVVTEFADTGLQSDSGSGDENLESGTESATKIPFKLTSYSVEIVCVSFLIIFAINYFTGKKENENLALSWASKFAVKDSIVDKNFSLLGVGETDDSPLLLKEGQTVFKFYASGRRFCTGLLATMELKSRHDLISRLYNMVVPCKDEITFEVYMNDDAMDHVVFALAKKKLAKMLQKEVRDLQRFAVMVSPPSGRPWVADELQVVAESKEVAADLLTEGVLDQVFGDKAFAKFGKDFISLHFSDQHIGSSKKMLVFKCALPDANHMADMTRLVALVPYYIDLVGRYRLSSHARSKTEAARSKVAQEVYKELHNARKEALQKKKTEQRKKLEEAEAKLSADALRKKEAKERARQMKKSMPKLKMTKAH